MDDDPRARLRVVAQYYVLLGGLCLFGGVALLLYSNLTPAPPPHTYYLNWAGVAGLAGVGLTLAGVVLVGVVVLSAVLDRRRK